MISKKEQIAFIRKEAASCKQAYDSLIQTFGSKHMEKIGAELIHRKQHYKAILQSLRKSS